MLYGRFFYAFFFVQTLTLVLCIYQTTAIAQHIGDLGANELVFSLMGLASIFFNVIGFSFAGRHIDNEGVLKSHRLFSFKFLFFSFSVLTAYFCNAPLSVWIFLAVAQTFFLSLEASIRQPFLFEMMPAIDKQHHRIIFIDTLSMNIAKFAGYFLSATLLKTYGIVYAFISATIGYIIYCLWNLYLFSKNSIKISIPSFKEHIRRYIINYFSLFIKNYKYILTDSKYRFSITCESYVALFVFPINTLSYFLIKYVSPNSNYHFATLFLVAAAGSFSCNVILAKKLSHKFFPSIVSVLVMSSTAFLIFFLNVNTYLSFSATFLLGASLTLLHSSSRCRLFSICPKDAQGKVITGFQASYSIMSGIGTFLYGIIVFYLGFKYTFLLFFILSLIFLMYLFKKRKDYING